MKRLYSSRSLKGMDVPALCAGHEGHRAWLGVDVSKTELQMDLRWADGSRVGPYRAENPWEITATTQKLKQLAEGRQLIIALEPSGTYGDAARQAWTDAGLTVHRVSAKASHDYAEVYDGVPSQHDGKDAAVCAELAAIGKSTAWPMGSPDEGSRQLRLQIDLLTAYQESYVTWCGRIEGWLGRHWPEAAQVSHCGSPTLMKTLAHYGSPAALAADPQGGARIRRYGGSLMKQETIDMLLRISRETVGVRCTAEDTGRIRMWIQEAQRMRTQSAACRGAIERLCMGHAAITRMAESLSVTTAAVLFVQAGDPRAYGCGRAYVKALGLNLKERSSGRFKGQLKITKRGSAQARRWLYFAALRAIQRGGPRAWYAAKVQRDGGRTLPAIVAVMRKLAVAVWRTRHNDVPYDQAKLFAPRPERKEHERGSGRQRRLRTARRRALATTGMTAATAGAGAHGPAIREPAAVERPPRQQPS